MPIKQISPFLSISDKMNIQDIGAASAIGIRSIINNRPDNEDTDQAQSAHLQETANGLGMEYRHIPVIPGQLTDENIEEFEQALSEMEGPVVAFCRTGSRSITLWALAEARHMSSSAILETTTKAGYDLAQLKPKFEEILEKNKASAKKAGRKTTPTRINSLTHDVVIVGGGAAGIASASSILKRNPDLDVTIIEPSEHHYYQPGWTLVGSGVFDRSQTQRRMKDVMPKGVHWQRDAVAEFSPETNEIILEDGQHIGYRTLIVSPGIKLNWDAIDGLRETLGKNGVTSNYLFDLAPYTWELVKNLKDGKALFTQPSMPIKCAGAPQKAMYMACSHWRGSSDLKNIDVSFHNAGGVLFGVKEYVPALMEYVKKYNISLNLNETLISINGPSKIATFEIADGEKTETVERNFDMIHVCPPQTSPEFIKKSPLSDDAGWVDVSSETLQHVRYGNIFSLGDACSAPNAKTAAAVRKQAPVVAENVCSVLNGKSPVATYSGYGSCPLTVEKGKVVLAEFAYGGVLEPSFPTWILDGTKPSKLAWLLKEKMMPNIYFDLMLKGREWLVDIKRLPHAPTLHDSQDALNSKADDKP